MSHELESGFFVREKAWHGLGTVLALAPTSADAIEQAGLDWKVRQLPVFTEFMDTEGISRIESADHVMNVRETDKKVLSVMGKGYKVLQNILCFEFFDPFIREGLASYEAAGSLKGGKMVWVLARLNINDADIGGNGDKIRPYILLTNTHDGSGSVDCRFTAIRVVCWNTVSAALADEGTTYAKVRHTKNVEANVTAVRNSISLAQQQFTATTEILQAMRSREITIPNLRDYARAVLSTEERFAELQLAQKTGKKVAEVRGVEEIIDLFIHGPGAELAGKTVYGAYNALTHYIDHKRGKSHDQRLASTWAGQGAKTRNEAFALARTI